MDSIQWILDDKIKVRRKVFVSYFHNDQVEVDTFISNFAGTSGVFIPKALGTRFNSDLIDSNNPEYVMQQIRSRYIGDSSVTMLLLGKCTHSRRYVDWELKASLMQPKDGLPNGLLAITLPSTNGSCHLPERFQANYSSTLFGAYARYQSYPRKMQQLWDWIEDAYQARTSRAHLINNSRDMMKYNSKCSICAVTH